ncbi:bifunctional 2-polyprenyl-6-hydroxyphenol methylase/3-demethylubiquinol 3-O-methyltransferase UbiG [Acinetobacter sp. Ac_5812]|uniref:bifunctional 2-polyprenyl-6-hydroxyphenol methylase/3-demethylubiquinol 3-O-methyltransferase UbiG n=1 Tax=Acinetobacter sp. Ac_5812 TaxID=1848937 RepID=UPI0014900ED0|nr:bifunctional 2-polyprenyl-6-hydroxyphenol methylase/3-demethylubiquinol 3-O-methyltransferase UbiG [Acinetobacter sp. Ac_5812]NNP70677.1 bifunctional 3-demethylubiquinol 3-O-methyltransferase/2-polyprenyl-6-hydroxyphenol methylase [Acinetobacter sp. Ac_5812]
MKPSNYDRHELAKFESISKNWWDRQGEFAPLHRINPLRLGWIKSVANGIQDKKILDVGCGGGILAESMARDGANVLGIDLGEQSIQIARDHALLENIQKIEYRNIAVEELAALAPQQYDIVTCMELLEHVPHPASIIQACAKLLKPNGLAFFSTINRNPKSYLFTIIAGEYILKLMPKGTHDFTKYIRPNELRSFSKTAGLTQTDTIGLHYNPITRYFWLAPDITVNYMTSCIKNGY